MTNLARVDIRQEACPMTYVKTKIALERLECGERLEVWLREGEPLESVPRSAINDGHIVLAKEPLPLEEGCWRLVLMRGEPAIQDSW